MNGSAVATNLFGYGAAGLAMRRAGVTSYHYSFDPSGNVVQRHQVATNSATGGPRLSDYKIIYYGFGRQLERINPATGWASV